MASSLIGPRTLGLWRTPGDPNRIETLKRIFECPPVYGDRQELRRERVHTICDVLQSFLFELPEPVFDFNLLEIFWSVCVDPTITISEPFLKRIVVGQLTLRMLEVENLSLISYLCRFFLRISRFPDKKLNLGFLSNLFGPALFSPRQRSSHLNLHFNRSRSSLSSSSTSSLSKHHLPQSILDQRAKKSLLWLLTHWHSIQEGLLIPHFKLSPSLSTFDTSQDPSDSHLKPSPSFTRLDGSSDPQHPSDSRLSDQGSTPPSIIKHSDLMMISRPTMDSLLSKRSASSQLRVRWSDVQSGDWHSRPDDDHSSDQENLSSDHHSIDRETDHGSVQEPLRGESRAKDIKLQNLDQEERGESNKEVAKVKEEVKVKEEEVKEEEEKEEEEEANKEEGKAKEEKVKEEKEEEEAKVKENHVSISNLTPESYHPSNRITSSPEVLTHSLAESVTNTSSRDSRYSSFSSAQSQFPNPSAFLKELELPRISLERSRPESAPSGTS